MRADRDHLLARLRRSFPGRCADTFLALQGLDRAMAIAAQAFTALIPLLLLTSALVPVGSRNVVVDAIIGRFRLTGDAAHDVEVLFSRSASGSTGVFSIVLLLFSGVSLTRRLQRMYLQAWEVEPLRGVRVQLDAAFALGALLVEVSLLYAVGSLVRGLPLAGALDATVSVGASLVIWTSLPWLLLDRRIPWRRLLPAGALTAVVGTLYGVATTVYMPRLMESYSQRYGMFGVTLALVGWLLCIAVIVVATTAVAAEFDRADEPWARRLRIRLRVEPVAAPVGGGPSRPPAAVGGRHDD